MLLLLAAGAVLAAEQPHVAPRPFTNPFFAMCTGTSDAQHASVTRQATMLRELGYDGIDHMGTKNVAETLREAKAAGLKTFAIYVGGIDIDPETPLPGGLREAIGQLEGSGAVVWIPLQSREFRLSSPAGDADAVEKVRAIADLAAASGVKVVLYPHANLWLERVEDAVRVVRKVKRANVGVTFNLCHWLKVSEDQDLLSILTRAMPYLMMVTVNGADTGGSAWGWSSLIQTLDRGSFETYRVLALLRELGYKGPIGLQGFGIGGTVHDNLLRSMRAWNKMTARLRRDGESYATPEAWLPRVLPDVMVAMIEQFKDGATRETFSTLARRLREAPDRLRPALEGRLIRILAGTGTADGKAQICRVLRDCGTDACVPALAELVHDARVGPVALDALQARPGQRAGRHLLSALDRADPATAIAIMSALGERRDDEAVAPIAAIARTASGVLADSAFAALGRIGSKPAAEALTQLSGHETTPEACAHAVIECAERLRAAGAPAEAASLYDWLQAKRVTPPVRIAAMRGLALSDPEEGVKGVIDALRGEDTALRQAAAAMASGMEGGAVTRAFCDALPTLGANDKVTVIHALSKRGDRLAAAAVAAEARAGPGAVSVVALRSLGVLGDASHLALLVGAAAGSNKAAAEAAHEALVALKGTGIDSALMSATMTSAPDRQPALIHALVARRTRGADPLFFHLANQADAEVRREAVRAMGQTADGEYLPSLLLLLMGTEDEGERGRLAKAVQSVAGRATNANRRTQALLAALRVGPATIHPDVLRLLGKFGGSKALEAVSGALDSDSNEIRGAALRALADWPDDSAFDLLVSIVEGSGNATERILALRGCVRQLGIAGSRSPAETLALYERALERAERMEEKRQVLAGIALVPDPRTLDVIDACRKEENLAAEARMAFLQAAKLVGSMQPDATSERLRKAIEEIDDAEFGAAAQTIIDGITAGQGQITSWMVAGPYGAAGDNLFDGVYPPEETTDGDVAWRAVSAMDGPFTQYIQAGDVNLIARIGGSNRVAYLRAGVYVPESRVASLEMGSDDGIKAWLNGELVHANDFRGALKRGRDQTTVHLDQGWNRLLLKITQLTGEWGASARIVTPAGDPVPGLLFRAE